jgi:flagellar motor switch protein FliG
MSSLRNAAVLIAALDESAAETILDAMSPVEAAKVRSVLVQLDEIPREEQQRVLADFFKQQGSPTLSMATREDVALELSAAVEPMETEFARTSTEQEELTPPGEPPLAFLVHAPAHALAAVLRREHPQVAAVVISQLPPDRAALVLEGLPSGLATDALERMAWLDDIAPEVIADLARELRLQLAPHLRIQAADPSALGHLSAVLGAMGSRQRERTLQRLSERNEALGKRLGARPAPAVSSVSGPARVSPFRYRLGPPLPKSEPEQSGEQNDAALTTERQRFAAAV